MFLVMLVLEDVLGFTIPSPIPLRTLSRIVRRLPLPISVQRRAMAVGQWAEEMKKVGADDDWRDFLGKRDRFSSSTTTSRNGFYSRFGGGGGRELTRGGNGLRNRTAIHQVKGSEEIALLSRNSLNENGHLSLDGQHGLFEDEATGSSSSSSSTRVYATALKDFCSRALSPITASNHEPSNLSSSIGSDPNELSSSSSNSKGKKKAKSSLDETLPSIINNGSPSRSSTPPPLRPISPSTASLLRTHAHSPPIRSPLGLTPSSPSSIVDMKEVDPFDSYTSPVMNGNGNPSSRRPSHPPFMSSKLAQSSSTDWSSSNGSDHSHSHTSNSPSISKSRNGYESVQTPGASPPSSPTQDPSNENSSRSLGGFLVQVG